MAKVTKFKDRQNNILLPVTRATLVEMNNGDSAQIAYEGINLTHYTKDEINAAGYITYQALSSYVTHSYLDIKLADVDKIGYITEYAESTYIEVGDTHDEAISKLIKIIDDNEYVVAGALSEIHSDLSYFVPRDEIENADFVTQNDLSSAGYLTEHQSLTAYANSAYYDSSVRKIYLRHDNTNLSEIDANDFIKDGMVDTAYVDGSYLVISFNTDAGKQPVEVPIDDIFDPSNYYDKQTVDEKVESLMQNQKLSFYTTYTCSVDIYTKDDTLNGDYSGETPINTFNYSANTLVQLNIGEDEHFEINNPNDGIKVIYSWAGICEKYYDWFMSVNMFCNMVFNFNKMDHSPWEHTNSTGSLYKFGVVEAQYRNCVFWWDVACTNVNIHCYMLHKTQECPIFYSTIPANTYKTLIEPYNITVNSNWTNPDFIDSFAASTGVNAFGYTQIKSVPFGSALDAYVATNIITLPADCQGIFYCSLAQDTATFDCVNVTTFGYNQSNWRRAFYECYELRHLLLKNLKVSVDLSWSPISNYSLDYIISQAANVSSIDIRLSPYTWYNLTDDMRTAATNKSINLVLGPIANNPSLKIWQDVEGIKNSYLSADNLDLSSYVSKADLSAAGYISSYIETDPTVPSYVKGITQADITNWNNKLDTFTETDPTIPSYVRGITEADISNWSSYANVQADWNETDNSLSSYILNKPKTLGGYDSVKVDTAYLTENGASTFSAENVRFCVTEELTLADSTEYEVGEGSILHFYNDGKLITDSSNPATLTFNNTQIEAPMKQIFDLNLLIGGLMRNTEVYPEWWGAKGDGETDDADAINAAIFNAGHMPVVLTAENYLVKSTIGAYESSPNPRIISVYNRESDGKTAGTDATALRWDSSAADYNIGMTLIIKHNLIGDSTLNGTVLSIDVCNAYVRVYGDIVVKSASDSAIGVQIGLNGNSIDSTNYYGDIKINTITRDYNLMTPYNVTTSAAHCSTYNLGLGTGVQITGFASTIKITEIFGFKYGVWLREKTQTCSLEFGAISAIYPMYIRSKTTGGYITRNKIYVHYAFSDKGLGTWNDGNQQGMEWISNVTNSALLYEDFSTTQRCEVSMNEWWFGDDNKDPQLPQNYLIYYDRSSSTPNHTGNKYRFNISLKSKEKLFYFHQGTGGSKSVDDEFWFGVNININQIDVAGNVWNLKIHNVNVHPTENSVYRWGLVTEPIRFDTVIYTQSSAPDSFNGTVIPILYPNPVFKDYITNSTTVPASLNNHQMVIVDNSSTNITTGGLTKYAVYAKQNGSVALVGYHINDELEPQFNASVASGITSTDITYWNNKLDSFTETDPIYSASAAAGITSTDISNWNSKTDNVGTITGINMNGASKGTSGVVDLGTVLTSHQSLSSYANAIEYNSSEKKIYLKHDSTTLGNPINATDFIKDGMVETAYVQGGNLIISFNTDAGKSPVSIPVTDIFNANNYYTKTEINNAGYLTSFTETDPIYSASAAAGITSSDITNWNSKTNNVGTITGITMNGSSKGTSGVVNLGTVVTSETDPIYSASAAAGITSTDISNWNSKTDNVGTITGITMNGASKGTSGVVDLGTVITSETQLSKGTTTGSGNAVTDISVSNHQITLTKGSTFLTSETDPVYSASAAASITASDITNWNNKTSNVGTITGITMNGSSKGTSGVVNLGTVITSETQLSKGTTSGAGNAVTDISVNNHQITLTKGTTFLTAHQDIKTINNQSITGTGNVTINALPTVSSTDNGKVLQVVNGTWTLVSPVTLYSGSGTPSNAQGNNGDLYMQI